MVSLTSDHFKTIAKNRNFTIASGNPRQHQCASRKRGQATGPNPTDRGKRGCKQHILSDAGGLPIVVGWSGANYPDTASLKPMIQNLPRIAGQRGRPISRPKKVYADKGYDSNESRLFLKSRGIIPRIARRGIESTERLGRVRWVIERTVAWFHDFRRLRTIYDRTVESCMAFMLLAASLICFRNLPGSF
jgi:transposase